MPLDRYGRPLKSGPTAIEYAIVASLIAIGLIAGAIALGDKLNNALTDITQTVKDK